MPDTILASITLDGLRDLMQQVGYRVETLNDPAGNAFLRSATGGVAFDIRGGNRLAGAGGYADLTFATVLQVQGDLPLDIVNQWNNSRRFARLHLVPGLQVFDMDVSVAGGVAPLALRTQIEIWDRLVQEFIPFLRDEVGKRGHVNGADRGAAVAAQQPAAAAPAA